MKPSLYYRASVNSEGKIDKIVEHFEKEDYKTYKADFPFEPDWDENRGPSEEDVYSRLKRCYHKWGRGCGSIYGKVPSHFKGVAIDLEWDVALLTFIFGKFGENDWRCHSFLPTYMAETGFTAHARAVGLLKELEPLVDELIVEDNTGLWNSTDPEIAKLLYGATFFRKSNGKP